MMYYRLSGFLFAYSGAGGLDGYVYNHGINQQIWVVGYISEVTTDVLWDIRFEMEKKYEDYR